MTVPLFTICERCVVSVTFFIFHLFLCVFIAVFVLTPLFIHLTLAHLFPRSFIPFFASRLHLLIFRRSSSPVFITLPNFPLLASPNLNYASISLHTAPPSSLPPPLSITHFLHLPLIPFPTSFPLFLPSSPPHRPIDTQTSRLHLGSGNPQQKRILCLSPAFAVGRGRGREG